MTKRSLSALATAVLLTSGVAAFACGNWRRGTMPYERSAENDANRAYRLSVGDAEIEYTDRGEGEPIFLVHAGVFADWFLPLSESRELAGFRVIRVRRAGYGSHSPKGHLTLADHARHIRMLAAHLNIPRLHYVGHSSSCQIGLELTLAAPALVKSLILIEPAAGGGFAVPATDAPAIDLRQA
jgi:pimeloyl-ACP methyl ester carboxylesterase